MLTLNIKHELFAQSLIIYKGNQTKAYLAVYKSCSYTSAPSKASRLVRNGNVLTRIYEIITGETALEQAALREISASLDANKSVRFKDRVVLVPDYRVRLCAAKVALKLLGIL